MFESRIEISSQQIDEWESELLVNQAEINRLYTRQVELIARLDPTRSLTPRATAT